MNPALKETPVLPGGYGRASYVVGSRAPRLVRGEGFLVQDEDGRHLIDANNNFATLVLGHANPAITAAVIETASTGTCYGLPNQVEERLAADIVDRLAHAEQVRFTNSGTEAVMTALRLARAATGRSMVLGIAGSYHGSSDIALAIGVARLNGVPESVQREVVTIPMNDLEQLRRAMAIHGRQLAAILIDLLPNYAGLVPADAEFIAEVRELCDEYGVVMIVDEVISFRLARGGQQSNYPVIPDLTALGKAIGGGLPIGAVAGAERIMRSLNPLEARTIESSGTFTGNPLSTAAGLACLAQFDEVEINRINKLGEQLLDRLLSGVPEDWRVRGTGSLVRVLAPETSDSREVATAFWWALYDRGVISTPSGLMSLSTPMNGETVDAIASAVIEAAMHVTAGAGMSA